MVRPEEALESLMTASMDIYAVSESVRDDGTVARTETLSAGGVKCRWETLTANRTVFADKAAGRKVIKAFYPKGTQAKAGDVIKTGGKSYVVLGVLTGPRSLTGTLEAALNE